MCEKDLDNETKNLDFRLVFFHILLNVSSSQNSKPHVIRIVQSINQIANEIEIVIHRKKSMNASTVPGEDESKENQKEKGSPKRNLEKEELCVSGGDPLGTSKTKRTTECVINREDDLPACKKHKHDPKPSEESLQQSVRFLTSANAELRNQLKLSQTEAATYRSANQELQERLVKLESTVKELFLSQSETTDSTNEILESLKLKRSENAVVRKEPKDDATVMNDALLLANNLVELKEENDKLQIWKIRLRHPEDVENFLHLSDSGKLKRLVHLDLSFDSKGLDKNNDEIEHRFITQKLPEVIGNLASLTKLNLSSTNISSLPPSIWQLKNLQDLNLANTKLKVLPDGIGHLTSLTNLNLSDTSSLLGSLQLPPSIGKLKNLKVLNLSNNGLADLPDAITNLTNLESMNLSDAFFESGAFPSTICQLQNLKYLDLSSTDGYFDDGPVGLPDAIGNLTSLIQLNISTTDICSLPPSIGKLKNLKVLRLANTEVKELPKEIGELTSLIHLNLLGTRISSLPPCMGQLKNLRDLYLSSTELDPAAEEETEKVVYKVACNRAGGRTRFDTPNLWPLILQYATRLFGESDPSDYSDHPTASSSSSQASRSRHFEKKEVLSKPDAIYRLLVEGRESFVAVLVNRSTKASPTIKPLEPYIASYMVL